MYLISDTVSGYAGGNRRNGHGLRVKCVFNEQEEKLKDAIFADTWYFITRINDGNMFAQNGNGANTMHWQQDVTG
jgi:hypothetical protein